MFLFGKCDFPICPSQFGLVSLSKNIRELTFNSDILSFFTKELGYKILVKIPDSVLDSALALQGKEGDIVREKL